MPFFDATFKVRFRVITRSAKEAEKEAWLWAQRIVDVETFQDASENGAITPEIVCKSASLEDVEEALVFNCWYAYWGWQKDVREIYDRAVADLKKLNGGSDCDTLADPLLFGPSHLVWEDENFESAEWCIEHFNEHKGDYSDDQLVIVMRSLKELAKMPVCTRCVEPSDYDGIDPSRFPPASYVKMDRERK